MSLDSWFPEVFNTWLMLPKTIICQRFYQLRHEELTVRLAVQVDVVQQRTNMCFLQKLAYFQNLKNVPN